MDLIIETEIEKIYAGNTEFGSPRVTLELRARKFVANEKRVARVMRKKGLQAITPGPHTSRPHPEHKVYPYLLRDVDIERVNQVWSTDITYNGSFAMPSQENRKAPPNGEAYWILKWYRKISRHPLSCHIRQYTS